MDWGFLNYYCSHILHNALGLGEGGGGVFQTVTASTNLCSHSTQLQFKVIEPWMTPSDWHIGDQEQLPATNLPAEPGNILALQSTIIILFLLKWQHRSLATYMGCAMGSQCIKPPEYPALSFLVLNKKILRTVKNCSQKGPMSNYTPGKNVWPSTAAAGFVRVGVIKTS